MKSLYAILRVAPKATAEEVDAAYQKLVGQFESGGAAADEDARSRLVAIREAYHVLSDPAARQMYDQKLAASIGGLQLAAGRSTGLAAEYAEPKHSLPLLKILLIGAIAIGGLVIYTSHVKEQERLRIEAAQAVLDKALALEKQKQEMAETEQSARLDRQERLDAAALEARNRYESNQAIRQSDIRSQQMAREEEQRRRQETNEKERQDRLADARRRQDLQDAQRLAAHEKQQADQLSRKKGALNF
jgi:curved DNA-binding protein CbpA